MVRSVPATGQNVSRYLFIAALVIAGEINFGLPFHTARFFRPTLLEVFGLTNTQLGDLFAVYGVTAMISYFPGGAIADRFPARVLLTASLVATACGGLYMATMPSAFQMGVLYGFWGFTTIFLFWGALIRATREWGGQSSQGTAFGILESGRGLAAALLAALAVAVLAWYLPEDATLATDAERRAGLRTIILLYSAATFVAAAMAWLLIPDPGKATQEKAANPFAGMVIVAKRPIVWAQAAIIVCAYCAYKGLDNYSLYAVQVLGMDEVEGARLASYGAYVRPVAALATGLIADRFDATRSIGVAFIVLAVVYSVLSMALPDTSGLSVIYGNMFASFFAVFALRGIYFALLQETRTPRHITGAAVGMISLVGYTPEIFFASIAGRILDATPGAGGHLNLFLFLASIAACGVAVVGWLLWLKRSRNNPWHEPVISEQAE
jgi:nitrate/nitrite transporter NarK